MAVNTTIIEGRLVRDPELRYTQSGTPVASFTIAWSEKIGDREAKLFLDCVAWRGTAEFVSRYFTKGKMISAEGGLRTECWQDRDGNNRYVIRLKVEKAHFCGSSEKRQEPEYSTQQEPYGELTGDDGDLPF